MSVSKLATRVIERLVKDEGVNKPVDLYKVLAVAMKKIQDNCRISRKTIEEIRSKLDKVIDDEVIVLSEDAKFEKKLRTAEDKVKAEVLAGLRAAPKFKPAVIVDKRNSVELLGEELP